MHGIELACSIGGKGNKTPQEEQGPSLYLHLSLRLMATTTSPSSGADDIHAGKQQINPSTIYPLLTTLYPLLVSFTK